MADIPVDVRTYPDGTLVIEPHRILGPGHTAELRRTLIHALRRVRPRQLVLDLHDLAHLDPISLGILALALTTAGVATHRLRHIDTPPPGRQAGPTAITGTAEQACTA